jgi:subtilase family serine protease
MGMNGRGKVLALILAGLLLAGGLASAMPRGPRSVDLSISAQDISIQYDHGGAPAVNDILHINATVHNQGVDPAYNVTVIFSYNTTNMPLFQLGRLKLNATGTVIEPLRTAVANFEWNTSGLELAPGQNYSVYVEVQNDTQPDNQSDPAPGNNIAFRNITFVEDVIPLVQDLTTSADNAVVGETVSLLATLGNAGIRPALAEPVSFHLDGSASPFCRTVVDIPVVGGATVPCDWNTSGAADGSHNLTVKVRESSRTVSVSLKHRVNPYIVSVTSSSYSARVGDLLDINVTLNNNGLETAQDVVVDFFLDARGVPMGNLTADEVAVGTPRRLSFSWDTAGTDTGVHTVKARLSGTAKEMRTANITLDVELFPDYAITDVYVSDMSPLSGTVLNISVNVSNTGAAAPRANTTLQVLLDSVVTVMEMTVEPLAPGAFLNTSFDWDTSEVTPARHNLRFQVNPYGDFFEPDDGNNDRLVQMAFRGSLDLSVRSITFSRTLNQSNATEEATVGESLWIWVNVANRGSLSSAANTTLALSLDGAAPFKTFLLYPIAPGRNFTAQFGYDTSGLNDTAATVHAFKAVVDGPRQNNDSDWGNNVLSANLTVRPAVAEADLAVLSVRTANPTARYEEVLMITASVANLGGRAARNFTVRFTYQAGAYPQLIGDQSVSFLGPGESRNVTQPWTVLVAEENYTINAVADPQNGVLETNKTNNAGKTLVRVLPALELRPELRLGTPSVQPREPRKGQPVNFTVVVTNAGNAPARGLSVTLLAGGKPAEQLNIPDLAPGANRTVTMTWKAQQGGSVLVMRVGGTGLAPVDTASVRVDTAAPAAAGGDYWPVLVVIVILIAAAVALAALGGRKSGTSEEE